MSQNFTRGMMARMVGMMASVSGFISEPHIMRAPAMPVIHRKSRNSSKNKGSSLMQKGMDGFHSYRGNNAGYGKPHQGSKECARRLRQRAKGMIL